MLKTLAVMTAAYLLAESFGLHGGLTGYDHGIAQKTVLRVGVFNAPYISHSPTNPGELAEVFKYFGLAMFLLIIGNLVKNEIVSQLLSLTSLLAAGYLIFRILTFEPIVPVTSPAEERLLSFTIRNAWSFAVLIGTITTNQMLQLAIYVKELKTPKTEI